MIKGAYKEGLIHYRKSPKAYRNPYELNSREYRDFDRGYFQGMSREPAPYQNNFDDSHYYYEMVNGEKVEIKTIGEQKAIDDYRKLSRGE